MVLTDEQKALIKISAENCEPFDEVATLFKEGPAKAVMGLRWNDFIQDDQDNTVEDLQVRKSVGVALAECCYRMI